MSSQMEETVPSKEHMQKIAMYIIAFIMCVIIAIIGVRLRTLYYESPGYYYLHLKNKRRRNKILCNNDIQSKQYNEDNAADDIYYASILDDMALDTILEDEPFNETKI
eukprot:774077_1